MLWSDLIAYWWLALRDWWARCWGADGLAALGRRYAKCAARHRETVGAYDSLR